MPFLAKEHIPIPGKDLLSWMFDDVRYDQDKPLYIDAVDPSKSISSRQAKSIIRRISAGLREAGLRKADTVCLHSFNDLYYPMIVLGTIAAGGIWTGTNPAYTPHELAHHVSVTRAKFFIVEEELMAPLLEATKSKEISSPKIWVFDHDKEESSYSFPSWKTLLEHGEADWERIEDEYMSRNTTAMLLTTSGTTGLPKAAELSHFNLIAEHTLVWERQIPLKDWDFKVLIALPMFHAAMGPLVHTSILASGFVAYVMRRFEPEAYMMYIEKYQINELLAVPPVILLMVMSPNKNKYDLSCIKRAYSGAAPLDKELQTKFESMIGGTLTQVWGMTESSCIISMTSHPHGDLSGSVGQMLPNCDIKFIANDGSEVTTPNTRGEMCVRGPTVVRGYLHNPEANARDWDRDGYYHSGDVGYFEEGTGKIFIVDRIKELIKVRGFQVAPNEIEGVLLTHPGVADAAVVGLTVPSSPDAELIRAYVVLKTGQHVSEDAIVKLVGVRLAKYKRITGGVKFVQAIPKTASGKILKRVLREEALKEIKSEGAKL